MGPPRLLSESPVYPRALGMGRAPPCHLEPRGSDGCRAQYPAPRGIAAECRGVVSAACHGGEKRASGEKRAPKQVFRTEFRLEWAFRRRFGAGRRVLAAGAYGTAAAASFSRRRAVYGSRFVRNLPCGVVFSPEGASAQRWRTEPCLRRRFLAGGRICAAVAYGSFLPASFSRRRAGFRSKCVRDRRCGVIFSPEAR